MTVLADQLLDPAQRPLADVLIEITNLTTGTSATIRSGRDGRWTANVPPGAYRVVHRAPNGATLVSAVELVVPAGGGPYSLNGLGAPVRYASIMGLGGGQGFTDRAQTDKTRAEQDLQLIADVMPGGWVLFNFDWPEIEPTQGEQDWSDWQWVIDTAHELGLRCCSAVLGTPSWANGGVGRFAPPLPQHLSAFCDYGAYMADHGADALLAWNEPNNIEHFWRPGGVPTLDPVGYAELTIALYARVKAANPDVPLIAGLTAPNGIPGQRPIDFWTSIMNVPGFAESYDFPGHHPYQFSLNYGPTTEAPWNACLQTRDLWQLQVDRGRTDPFWLTEYGATTDGSLPRLPGSRQIPEELSAVWTAQYHEAFARMESEGVGIDVRIQYAISDNGPMSSTDEQDHFGQVRYDRSEKPQLAVIRAQAAARRDAPPAPTPPPPPPPEDPPVSQLYDTAVLDTAIYA